LTFLYGCDSFGSVFVEGLLLLLPPLESFCTTIASDAVSYLTINGSTPSSSLSRSITIAYSIGFLSTLTP